jgi:hypothetical protein
MSTYGRQSLVATGRPVMVAAGESRDIRWKTGGVTIDWSLVAAVSGAALTLLDDTVVAIGQKFLRFGQILCRVRMVEVQSVTLTSATGGTFTLAGSVAIAYNAAAATVQAALETIFGAGLVTVSGSAGGPYTVTFDKSLGNVATMAVVDSTTGSGHSVVAANVSEGSASADKYGPYDPAATDGRQLLVRGDAYILNQTVLENGLIPGLGGGTSDNPAVLEGGYIWKARVLMTTGTHSLAAGPTVAEFETLFHDIHYVQS